MKAKLWCLLPALAVAGFSQNESAITREGQHWVQTVSGSMPQAGDNLRIVSTGSVAVKGENRGDLYYTMKKQVRAHDQAQARDLLNRITLRSSGGLFEVSFPDHHSSAELRVLVRNSLRDLAVESRGGEVDVQQMGGAVRADTGGGEVHLDGIQGGARVRTGGGEVNLGRVNGRIECFTGGGAINADVLGGDASLNTGGGEVVVREAQGPLQVQTGGGDIRVQKAAYGLTMRTGGGEIGAMNSNGPVRAETGAGGIVVHSAKGVECNTGAGTIKLQSVSGRLRAATGTGTIWAELAKMKPLEDSWLSTENGDITVVIPSNLAVTVEAVTNSPGIRKIVSDFAEIRVNPESRGSRAEAHGSLNGGGPVLKLAASGGTIYLRREK